MQAGTLTLAVAGWQVPLSGGLRRMALGAALAAAILAAGCASRGTPAPIVDLSAGQADTTASASVTPASGGTHTVVQGDTLFKIAQKYGMDVNRLAQINHISDPGLLRIGQVLQLDGSSSTAVATQPVKPVQPVTPVADAGASTTPGTGTTPASGTKPPPAASSGTKPDAASSSSAPRASDASLISWAWPASGRIIQGFNASTKGIDIEGATGDTVKAAADGKVMYAGNGVRGLGNLILLGHSDGFITAYAHNQALQVKTGEQVKKGQQIATIGQSDTTSPRLHFEIRRRGTPVNPMSYLPAR